MKFDTVDTFFRAQVAHQAQERTDVTSEKTRMKKTFEQLLEQMTSMFGSSTSESQSGGSQINEQEPASHSAGSSGAPASFTDK